MAILGKLGRAISRFVGEWRKRRQLELELETLRAMGSLDSALADAGLVRSQREGRSIIYSANFEFMSGLLRFMLEDCCGGSVGLTRCCGLRWRS